MNAGGTAITTPTTLAGALQLRDWTLDGVGNWASNDAQSVGGSLLTANRQHTNFNEIADVSGDVPAATFDNDDNGNLLTDAIYDYQWDALNRLRSVTRISDGLIIATSTYDCQNRRMRKVVTNSGSLDGTTDYYYAGWRVCEEYTLSGSTETLKYQYVWGATYHDELISRDDRGTATVAQLNDGTGADRQFQHGNTLFSVFAVTDETGAVLERYQYDPCGDQTVMDAGFVVLTSSAIDQEFSYTGQRFDTETSLYYYKNRYYSSNQGRFISRDPIGYHDGMNLYEYTGSNSINSTDPTGEYLIIIKPVLKKIIKKIIKKLPKPKKPKKPGKPKEPGKKCKKCKPCIPAKGTKSYRTDFVPPSDPHWPFTGTHTHHYQMHQSPPAAGCICFWHPIGITDGASPGPGELPVGPAGGGGVAP